MNTNPEKYCKDIESYEHAIATAVDELQKLMNDGYICYGPAKGLWHGLLDGLYGSDRQSSA